MTTITLPRAVVEQTLNALDAFSWEQVDAARIALRAALAEPETTCRRAICQRGPDGYCAPCHERTYP